MSVLDQVRVIIYRYHEKGLEIFLVNNEMANNPEVWKLPNSRMSKKLAESTDQIENGIIELDSHVDENGQSTKVVAFEGDWHDIPSIRGMLRHDVKIVKNTVKDMLPGIENGAYFAFKEAFKKVLPKEYSAIKELRDILRDRNLMKYM